MAVTLEQSSVAVIYFKAFQFTLFDEFFLRVAALPLALLHCAIVGLQAGYDPPLVRDLRPQGPPVLQLTQPLPLLRLNHFLRPSLFATFLAANIVVFCANFTTADHMP